MKVLHQKSISHLIFVFVILAAILTFPVTSVSAENYKIGLLASNDIRKGDIFTDVFDGATLALAELGQEGSIVKLTPPFKGTLKEKFTILNDEQVLAGTIILGSPLESAKITKGMNLITNPILLMGITARGKTPWSSLYQLSPADDLQFEAMLTHSIKRNTNDSIVAIVVKSNESDTDKDILKPFLKKNTLVTLIHLEETAPGNLNKRRQELRTKLATAKPSAVFIGGSSGDVLNTIKDLRTLRIHCPVYVRLNEATRSNVKKMSSLGNIYAVTAASHMNNIPGEPGFIERFTATYGREPSSWAALAYDGARQITRGMDLKGPENENLATKLMRLPLEFGSGFAIDFSLETRWYPAISKLKQGKLVVVQLPGMSEIPWGNKRKIATSMSSSPSTKKVSRSSNNRTSRPSNYRTSSSTNQGYKSKGSSKSSRKSNNRNDITQTGVVRKWNHFLVLPK